MKPCGCQHPSPIAATMQTAFACGIFNGVAVLSDARVRWAGLDWYGMPMPLRLALWIKLIWTFGHDAPSWEQVNKLPGCGCIVALKDRWERLTAWTRIPA